MRIDAGSSVCLGEAETVSPGPQCGKQERRASYKNKR